MTEKRQILSHANAAQADAHLRGPGTEQAQDADVPESRKDNARRAGPNAGQIGGPGDRRLSRQR